MTTTGTSFEVYRWNQFDCKVIPISIDRALAIIFVNLAEAKVHAALSMQFSPTVMRCVDIFWRL